MTFAPNVNPLISWIAMSVNPELKIPYVWKATGMPTNASDVLIPTYLTYQEYAKNESIRIFLIAPSTCADSIYAKPAKVNLN
jgi:hypothetical protein